MIDVRFHPLDMWPGPETLVGARKSRWSFRASWGDTLALLDDELHRLRARDIVIQADFAPGDIRLDGWPRADARAPFRPGVILSFESRHGPLRYLTDRYEFWQHNLRAIALGLGALRAVDRYGITERGEQYQGWAQLPTSTDATPLSTLLSVVADDNGWADKDPKSLYREALKRAHPDHGGTAETFALVQEAGRRLGVA